MEATVIRNERSNLFQIKDETNVAHVNIPNELQSDKDTSIQFSALSAALSSYAESVKHNATRFKDEVSENGKVAEKLYPTLKGILNDVRGFAKGVAETDRLTLEVAPQTDGAFDAAFVARIEALAPAQRLTSVGGLSFAQSSALLRHGDLDRLGLPEKVTQAVRNRHRILGHIERSGLRASYPRRATLADPLATGVDEAAVYAAAEAALARHEERRARVALAADTIRSVASFLAIATRSRPEQIWTEMTR